MFKSNLKLALFLLTFCLPFETHAADLLEVYQAALEHDTIFQQSIASSRATKENLPIAISALLPNVFASAMPTFTSTSLSGGNMTPVSLTPVRAYSLSLNATQTVFNFAQFATVAEQAAISKEADATLNAALQNLIVRVTTAYLAILEDEEDVAASLAAQHAYAAELKQIKAQYQVGQKTMTDVYTARASYDLAVATTIASRTKLADDQENLRVITGHLYKKLDRLSVHFPLITPAPQDINAWANIASHQNWAIKAAQYNVSAARQVIKQQFAGHLPIVTVQGTIARTYSNNLNGFTTFNGSGRETNSQGTINVNLPLFSGGGVVAATNQAKDNYQIAESQLDQTILNTLNITRQSYLGIVAGRSQIKADELAIKSTSSSLAGLKESFAVGAETLVDLLNQQQKVFQAETRYAADRYQFVNNIFALKQAAGTLGLNDLRALNGWLSKD